jgi:histone acetyltransferase (RNA polymerase elongator complex component)
MHEYLAQNYKSTEVMSKIASPDSNVQTDISYFYELVFNHSYHNDFRQIYPAKTLAVELIMSS